jgi:hypothetical protein
MSTLSEEENLTRNRLAHVVLKRLSHAETLNSIKESLATLSKLYPHVKFRFDPLQKDLSLIHRHDVPLPVVLDYWASCRIVVTSPTDIEVAKDLLSSGSIQSCVGKWSHFQKCCGLSVGGGPDAETLAVVSKIYADGAKEASS